MWHCQASLQPNAIQPDLQSDIKRRVNDLCEQFDKREFVVYYLDQGVCVCANPDATCGYSLYVPYVHLRNYCLSVLDFARSRPSTVESLTLRELVYNAGVKAFDVTYPPGWQTDPTGQPATVIRLDKHLNSLESATCMIDLSL